MQSLQPIERIRKAHPLLAAWIDEHPDVAHDIFFHLRPNDAQKLLAFTDSPASEDHPPSGPDHDPDVHLARLRRTLRRALGALEERAAPQKLAGRIVRHPDATFIHLRHSLFCIPDAPRKDLRELDRWLGQQEAGWLSQAQGRLGSDIQQVIRDRLGQASSQECHAKLLKDYTQIVETILLSSVGPGGWAAIRLDHFTEQHARLALTTLGELAAKLQDLLPEQPCPTLDDLSDWYQPFLKTCLQQAFPGPDDFHMEVIQEVAKRLPERGYATLLRWDVAQSRKGYLCAIARNVARDLWAEREWDEQQRHAQRPRAARLRSIGRYLTLGELVKRIREAKPQPGWTDAQVASALADALFTRIDQQELPFDDLLILGGKLAGRPSSVLAHRLRGSVSAEDEKAEEAEIDTRYQELLQQLETDIAERLGADDRAEQRRRLIAAQLLTPRTSFRQILIYCGRKQGVSSEVMAQRLYGELGDKDRKRASNNIDVAYSKFKGWLEKARKMAYSTASVDEGVED